MTDLSPKQLLSIKECSAKINIWEGAVRSGKTYASLWAFMSMITHGEAGEYAILTRTYDSFKRNLMPQLYRMIGTDAEHYSGKRELHLWGKTIHVIGCDDERAESKLRGATFEGAYCDEMTILPEGAVKMLVSRCAMGKSRILGTTNPDSPFHYIKTEFLTDNPDVKSWQFTLDDNPQLTFDEKSYLKRQYKGLWYRRFILGEWCQAQGAVFDFFDKAQHTIGYAPTEAEYYVVGIDYGTTNPFAAVLVGYSPRGFPKIWVEDEYYWDSAKRGRQKTDSEYAKDLMKFIDGKNVKAIYIDPSAASFKVELQRSSLRNLRDANNDVMNGIRNMSDLLVNGSVKICSGCHNLLGEMESYVWDPAAAKRGEDKPLKKQDHCFAAGTLVTTQQGNKSIETICEGEMVWTRQGLKPVIRIGSRPDTVYTFNLPLDQVTCTEDHKFFTYSGWKEIRHLTHSDILYRWGSLWGSGEEENGLNFRVEFTDAIQTLQLCLEETTLLETESISIEKFGSQSMEKFPTTIISITKTGTPLTMIYPISNVWDNPNIFPTMRQLILNVLSQMQLEKQQEGGMGLPKELNGIESTLMPANLETTLCELFNANCVAPVMKQDFCPTKLGFVRISVSLHGEEKLVLTMREDAVMSAKKSSNATDIATKFVVEGSAQASIVHNLEVQDCPEFFANGWLVHNCVDATRYSLLHPFFTTSTTDWDEVRRKALDLNVENFPGVFR